jgi:hypothetical protein
VIAVRYEGLRETLQALRIVEYDLYRTMLAGLKTAGEIVRRSARQRFADYGSGGSAARTASFLKAADGFQTLVRPNTSTMAIVSVGQTLRSTVYQPRRRPEFGGLMMRKALLPARGASMGEAVAALDAEVVTLLHTHGF